MSNKVYEFCLKKDENTFLYVDGDSIVNTTPTETPLKYSPVNWDSIELHISRNETNWGIISKRAPQLTFAHDGAEILRYLFYQSSYEAKCILVIKKFNPTTYSFQPWGECDVDFSFVNDEDDIFTVNLVERGLYNLIEARRDVPYEIPLDDPDSITCLIDGIKIKNLVSYTPITHHGAGLGLPVNLISNYRLSELGTGYMPNDISSTQLPAVQFFTAATNDPVKVTLKNLKLDYNYNCTVWISKNGFGNILWQWDANLQGNVINQTFTFPMNAGDTLRLLMDVPPKPTPSSPESFAEIENVDNLNKAIVEVEAVLRFAPTTAKGLRYYHFAQKIVNKLTNEQYTLQSDFLSNQSLSSEGRRANWDNDPWNTIVLCGNSIRGISGSAIKATLTELFNDCWVRWCLGFGIENNVLRIEPLSYFLNKSNHITTIQSVKNIKVNPYMDKVATHIEVGYNSYEYDELSGKEEYNTSLTFLFNKVTRKETSPEKLITPFRADMYGIEKLRNYLNPDAVLTPQVATIDNSSDNNTFLLEVSPLPINGQYVPYRLPNGIQAGVTNPESAYNVTMSPGRIFRRHLPRLRSMLPDDDKGQAIYQTTDKNSELISNYGNGLITENLIEKASIDLNSDTNLNRSVPIIWRAYKITANVVPDRQMQIAIETNKYGFIQLVDNKRNRVIKGFILDSVLKTTRGDAGVNDSTDFTLLSHPDSILS